MLKTLESSLPADAGTAGSTPTSISIVIPAYNSAQQLKQCLEALWTFADVPLQIIVVDDGSTDDTTAVACGYCLTLLRTDGRRGPAFARNLGAKIATGDILLFLDSDVCVQCDTIQRIRACFDADPELDALIGSYDSEPRSPDFLSQYRNLMHSYVHQTGDRRASTFWSGCGAIRRVLFLEHSGFNECFDRSAIEDIELGYRLIMAGRKIVLDRMIQVSHLKRWTFWSLVKTDIFDRGIPWTELILRDRFMPDDLNLQLSQRVSVALVFILAALSGFTAVMWGGYFLIPLFTAVFILLGRWWGEFSAPDRPRAVPVVFFGTVATIATLAYSHHMFGLIPPLMLGPALLLTQHRYATRGSIPKLIRRLTLAYTGCSILAALLYLPHRSPVMVCFVILATLGLMNSQFYLFLAGKRGIAFALAAIPFHLLFHFYCGVSFIIGVFRHLWMKLSPADVYQAAHGATAPETALKSARTTR
jgi:GT2 family glycosyltransferase